MGDPIKQLAAWLPVRPRQVRPNQQPCNRLVPIAAPLGHFTLSQPSRRKKMKNSISRKTTLALLCGCSVLLL